MIIMGKENENGSRGFGLRGLFLCQKGAVMAYRKVGYLEQVWYIIKYKLRELFHGRK